MKNGRYESNGTVEFYKDDKLHRDDDLPAVINADGYKFWYSKGELHREGKPAIQGPEGDQAYYFNGKLHNEEGPALTNKFGKQEWHIDGIQYTQQEFNDIMRAREVCEKYGKSLEPQKLQRAKEQTKSIDR